MRFVRELSEPWGLLLAASSAGAAWAVQLPVAAAVGIGAAVLVARAGIAGWQRRSDKVGAEPELPAVDSRSVEGLWLRRAENAARAFHDLATSMSRGPLADTVAEMSPAVDETLQTLGRLAGRAGTTRQAVSRIDAAKLADEQRRLQGRLANADSNLREHLEHSLASVVEQQAVYERLSSARAILVAQLESGTLGLEGLAARLVELSATTDATPALGATTVGELTDRLEGIRHGVVETEQATRNALGGG